MTKSLRVVADVASLQGVHRERGISRYTENLLLEISRKPSVDLMCRVHPRANGLRVGHPLEHSVVSDYQIEEILADDRRTPTVYLLTSPFESVPNATSLIPSWAIERELPVVSIVYDLIPGLFPSIYLPTDASRRWYETRLFIVSSSDLVLSISEATKRDVLDHTSISESRVINIGGGVDTEFFVLRDPGAGDVRSGSVVCVAGYEPRKNVPRLLEAWSMLPRHIRAAHVLRVVCSLPERGREEWTTLAHGFGLGPEEFTFTGHVTDEELRDLYRSARLVVAPYLYEGFGLPVAEAACCGAPVIYSRTSSLPEILNNPAAEFDPLDCTSIAQSLANTLGDDGLLAEFREVSLREGPKHTWRAVADRAIAAVQPVARPPKVVPQQQKRLLFVTPTAPSLSGVAIYSTAVMSAFSSDIVVTTVEDHSPGDIPTKTGRLGVPQARSLLRRFDDSDENVILVALGNSDYHMSSLEIALAHPVNVWLHDLALPGLITSRARRLPDVGARIDWINGLLGVGKEPERALVIDRSNYLDDAFYRANGVRFIEPVIARATRVIVNSEIARSIVLSTGMIDGRRVKCIPHAYRTPPAGMERAADPTIVSMGWVGPLKRPQVLIDALKFIDPLARLVFAGPVEAVYAAKLREIAASAGVADRVSFTGSLTEPDYWMWCAKAWVGVQLRLGSNAESSGAVADLMSSGTPVVTDLPTAREIDPRAVIQIEQNLSPEEIGRIVGELLVDSARREYVGASARDVASKWTYRSVAASVADFLFQDF